VQTVLDSVDLWNILAERDALRTDRDNRNAKLNHPETAPRNGVTILGLFRHEVLFPAVRVLGKEKWAVALAVDEEGFFNGYYRDESLRGWMYLPDIDDEGNLQ